MATGSRRLFFALWPDDSVRRQIVAACGGAIQAAGGRPIPPENYHITLAFLGNVTADRADAVRSAARAVSFPPFTVALDRTGYWPRPRVAWLKPAVCPPELAGLAADLWAALAPIGFTADSRTYKPHVSLVRRVPGGLGSRLPEPVSWPVSEFVLARSETRPEGAVYTLVERFPATG